MAGWDQQWALPVYACAVPAGAVRGAGVGAAQQLHRRIGLRLEAGYGAQAGEIAAQLAVHFERGGEMPRAVHYWQHVAGPCRTGAALSRSDRRPEERRSRCCETLPESPERTQHELALQLALGELLRATKGVGSPDVGEVYTRAYALCQQMEETPQLARVLWGLSQFQMNQGQLATADALARQLFDLAQRQPDTECLVEGHFLMGTMAFYRGDFLAARAHLEQSWLRV